MCNYFTMERMKEVKMELGPQNYKWLLDEIRNGIIKKGKVKIIALKMHDRVHGGICGKGRP